MIRLLKRRWLWLVVALLLLLLAIPGYWVVPGLIRQERFYHGLPSSYWASAIGTWIERAGRKIAGKASFLDELESFVNIGTKPSVLDGDPGAVPVLLELLAGPETPVRIAAFSGLALAQGWVDNFSLVDRDFALVHLVPGPKRQFVSCTEVRLFPLDSAEDGFLILADLDTGLLMGGSLESVYLVDKNGNLLDSVLCELDIGGRGLKGPRYESRVEGDGAQIVIDFVPDDGINYAGCRLEIVQAGRTLVYNWGTDWSAWHRNGICRLLARQGRLQILFPDPAKADEVRQMAAD
jgi:hypothetical protein